MTVKAILDVKGHDVMTIGPDSTLADAAFDVTLVPVFLTRDLPTPQRCFRGTVSARLS